MPKHLTARPPLDAPEERRVRKLTRGVHAPAGWILHAKMVAHSWDGRRTRQIAEVLGCHPQAIRERLQAFNDRGFEDLGMQSGGGRKPRLTQCERSTILYVVQLPPPGKPTDELTGELDGPDPTGASEWALEALTAMARKQGIQVTRSQVRRLFRQEGVRWRHTRLWASSKDPDFIPRVPKEPRSSRSPPTHPRERPSSVSPPRRTRLLDELASSTNSPPRRTRRTRPSNAAQVPTGFGLVARWAPHHNIAQLRPRSSEGVGVGGRGSARRGRPGPHPDGCLAQHHRLSGVASDARPHLPQR